MKRWILLTVAVVMISAAATVAVQYLPASQSSLDIPAYPTADKAEEKKGPPPIAEVEGDTVYKFGIMSQEQKGNRDWVIKNVGQGDLVLTGGHPSCSCTLANLMPGKNVTVKPGSSFTLKVEWQTKQFRDKYVKEAALYTNDPTHPELKFVIEGEVQPPITMIPESPFDLGAVSNDKPRDYFVAIGSADKPDLKLTSIKVSRPELIEVTEKPLTADEARALKFKGYRLTLTVKPTKALGTFHEELIIKTDHPVRDSVILEVIGKVVGPISVTPSSLRSVDVSSSKGEVLTGTIWVRGQENTKFEVRQKPDKVKVAVVPVDEKNKDSAANKGRAYRLTAAIDPGTPTGVIEGTILLGTDHPNAGEVKVPFYAQVIADD